MIAAEKLARQERESIQDVIGAGVRRLQDDRGGTAS
jgi:hypothetical protein